MKPEKCRAIITFLNCKDAELCVDISNNKIIKNYIIFVRACSDKPYEQRGPGNVVVVSNLPASINDGEIYQIFEQFGHIVTVEIQMRENFDSCQFQKEAIITYSKFEDARTSIKAMTDKVIRNRQIKIDYKSNFIKMKRLNN